MKRATQTLYGRSNGRITQYIVPAWKRAYNEDGFQSSIPKSSFNQAYVPHCASTSTNCYHHLLQSKAKLSTSAASPSSESSASSESSLSSFKLQYDQSPAAAFQQLQDESDRILNDIAASRTGSKTVVSRTECYEVLSNWLEVARQTRNIKIAYFAESFILSMEPTAEDNHRLMDLSPSRVYYDLVLSMYAASGNHGTSSNSTKKNSAEAAEELLAHMMDISHADEKVRPTYKSFNIVINCWAKSKAHDAAQRVLGLIKRMEEYHEEAWNEESQNANDHIGSRPTAISIAGLIEALSNTGDKEVLDQIVGIMQKISDEYRNGAPNAIQPDTILFNKAISCISSKRGDRKEAQCAEHLMGILIQLSETQSHKDSRQTRTSEVSLGPNTRTYAMLINAWKECESKERQGDAAKRAGEILHEMVERYQKGQDVKPNARTFTTCITALAQCAGRISDAAQRAEQLLDILISLHQNDPDDADFQLDVYAGNSVLAAWSRSRKPQAVERIKSVIEKLKPFATPDRISYNSLLHAYNVTGDSDSALELLDWLEEQGADNESLQPDSLSYNIVLNGLQSPEKAESLLEQMTRLSSEEGREGLRPTKFTYTTMVKAYKRSEAKMPSIKAFAVLERMMGTKGKNGSTLAACQPDAVMLMAILQTCSHDTVGRDEDIQIVTKILAIMKGMNGRDLNPEVFCSVLEAYSRLIITKEAEDCKEMWIAHIEPVLTLCKSRGLLSRRMLRFLRRRSITDDDVLQRVLGTSNTGNLPKQWSRAVPTKLRP